jgi:hypothetical protein
VQHNPGQELTHGKAMKNAAWKAALAKNRQFYTSVIPAEAGIHALNRYPRHSWIPAFAGMTGEIAGMTGEIAWNDG